MGSSALKIVILALDPATETGWCLGSPGEVPRLGTLDLNKRVEKSRGYAFEFFRRWLLETITSKDITHIIFESPILTKFHNIHMTRMAQGLDAHIEAAVAAHNQQSNRQVTLTEATPGQIKKALTGKGNAKKDEMMRMTWARGLDPNNNNEADAFGAYLCVLTDIAPDDLLQFDPINHGRLT